MLSAFQFGFWHPFGAYTGQSGAEVLAVKRAEVQRNQWTLWSFVYSSSADIWLEQLSAATGPVHVLCSHSPKAVDPDLNRGEVAATHYRELASESWQAMPAQDILKVTNPFKNQGRALAFKVVGVHPIEPAVPSFGVEWYSRQERRWRGDKVPTRGEYLIRRGGSAAPRAVGAVLELAPPYLVVVRRDGVGG
jgi:hypothetical protein